MSSATRKSPRISTRAFTIAAVLFALAVACVVSLFASGLPDGLEFVAASTGFLDTAADSATAGGPFAGYESSFVPVPWLGVMLAGAVGCVVTFAFAWAVGVVPRRRRDA